MRTIDALTGESFDEISDLNLSGITLSCECEGETTGWRCTTLEGVSQWPGEVFELNDILMAMCPDCANICEVDINVNNITEETYELTFVLGDIRLAAEEAAEGTIRQFNERIEEAVGLDPNRLASCTTCGEPVYPKDKTEGSDAPEIGWQYYECSGCGEQFAPWTMEGKR